MTKNSSKKQGRMLCAQIFPLEIIFSGTVIIVHYHRCNLCVCLEGPYCKASFRGAYEHDPFWSVFEEHRRDSTTTDITTALFILSIMSLYYMILWNQVDILPKHFKKDHVHMRLWTRFYSILTCRVSAVSDQHWCQFHCWTSWSSWTGKILCEKKKKRSEKKFVSWQFMTGKTLCGV